jgi:arylsulfatase
MPDQPNFLFIFPDQWRGDCLGSLGHPVVETPFLDQLAAEGVTFTAAYTACPSCIATRASLITGQTPNTCGRIGYRDGVPWRYETTLMRCLRDGGYQTFCAGKTHFYPQRIALGFEEMRLYDVLNIERDFKSDYHAWLEQAGGGLVRDTTQETTSNAWLAHPWVHPEYLHPNTWTATAAIELLSRRDPTRPFFLQVSFHRPHPPLDPPIDYYERYQDRPIPLAPVGDWAEELAEPVRQVDASSGTLPEHVLARSRRAYYAQMSHIDYQVGRLLYWLMRRGWLDNTYIIFSSDHGELLGDHHLFRKVSPLEGSAKVPLIVRPPRSVKCPRGSSCDLPVAHMDLMPTILEEAGLAIPAIVEGSSLVPAVRGQETEWRDFIHGEHTGGRPGNQYVTDGKEKFIWDSRSGRELFFDLSTDPPEETDRSHDPAYTDRVTMWRKRLIDVLAERPQDGLSDGERLMPGREPPAVRPELLEKHLDPDGRERPM